MLAGASLGGLFIRDYASRYPSEVAGLVFVDGRTPLISQNPKRKAMDQKMRLSRFDEMLNRVVIVLGVPRLHGLFSDQIPGLDARTSLLVRADEAHEPFATMRAEAKVVDSLDDAETVRTGPYGDRPILILSADPEIQAANGWPADLLSLNSQAQEDLKKLSTRSLRVIAKGSGHRIVSGRTDLIATQTALFVEQIRGTVPQPAQYGVTTSE